METLEFNSCFTQVILDKCKSSTIRRHTDLKKGDLFTTKHIPNKIFKVTNVNRIRIDEIDNDIAFKEGYRHEELLLKELTAIYPSVRPASLVYQIEFEMLE